MADGRDTDIRVLGPLEIRGPHGNASVSGNRRRTLLGLFGLCAGDVLSRPALIEALWGEAPPITAIKTLHSHVAVVRRALEAAALDGLLATKEPGYVLRVPAELVDAGRFEDWVRRGRRRGDEGDFAGAVGALRLGLGLWHGDVLADCQLNGWGIAVAARLRELRLAATEELWEAELNCGNHGAAAVELLRLASMHPLRERLWEMLMLALYRCGRRGESLLVFEQVRSVLQAELAIEPGPGLWRLRSSVLAGTAG